LERCWLVGCCRDFQVVENDSDAMQSQLMQPTDTSNSQPSDGG